MAKQPGIVDSILSKVGLSRLPSNDSQHVDFGLEKSFEMLKSAKTNVGMLTNVEVRDGCFHRIQPARHLMNIARSVWIVKACNNKIASEVTKFGYDFLPNFSFRCKACGAEFDHKPDGMRCHCGSTDLQEPDPRQLTRIRALFKRPNVDAGNGYMRKPMKEMLKDSTVYLLSIADWFWTIHRDEQGVPTALDICPSEYIKECLPATVYFCPFCAGERTFNVSFNAKGERCRKHDVPLIEAGYLQEDADGHNIMAWKREDVLHGQVDAYGNRKVGESRLMALIKECQTINWTGMYIWSSLSMSKRPGKIAVFPGMTQEDVHVMLAAIYKFKSEHPEIQRDLWLGTPNLKPEILDMMGQMSDESLVALRSALAEEIALTYGVSMSFLGKPTPGKLGNPEDQMEVSIATVREVQESLDSFVNNQVLSQFYEITDWHFVLEPPTEADVRAEAEFREIQARTVATLRSAGLDAILNDDFEVVLRGELKMTPAASYPGALPFPQDANAQRANQPPPVSPTDEDDDEDEDAVEAKMFYKGITPRYNPDFVSGAAALEREFSVESNRILTSAAERIANGTGAAEAEAEVNRELDRAAKAYTQALFRLSYDDEKGELGVKASAFEQVDENALEVVMQGPEGMLDAIKSTSREVVMELYKNVAEATAKPGGANLKEISRHLAQIAGEQTWKMERIVRSETTKISNLGRVRHWEKSDPEGLYTLSVSHSPGRPPCKLCRAIVDMGPMSLADLRKATNNLLPHPHCCCTVVRVTPLSEGTQ